ncbi:MAG TPA: alpha/beta hydrolase [Streptosporangiaceae bacterium]
MATTAETDLRLSDGTNLHVYDTGPATSASGNALVVMWHCGTPNIGTPPAPLFAESDRLGIRWVSYDRPGYRSSTPQPGRPVASAARFAAAVADHLGIGQFAAMGHSGGSPHALACGALLSDRVLGVVSGAGLAPFGAAGLDWYGGMNPSAAASLRAAAAGRAEKERFEASAEFDPEIFTAADHAALQGPWSWFGQVVGPAIESGPAGLIDDDMAYVAPWGFEPAGIRAPVLLMHGRQDRIVPSSHSEWLAQHCPDAELRVFPEDGHISVLNSAAEALRWLSKLVLRAA